MICYCIYWLLSFSFEVTSVCILVQCLLWKMSLCVRWFRLKLIFNLSFNDTFAHWCKTSAISFLNVSMTDKATRSNQNTYKKYYVRVKISFLYIDTTWWLLVTSFFSVIFYIDFILKQNESHRLCAFWLSFINFLRDNQHWWN